MANIEVMVTTYDVSFYDTSEWHKTLIIHAVFNGDGNVMTVMTSDDASADGVISAVEKNVRDMGDVYAMAGELLLDECGYDKDDPLYWDVWETLEFNEVDNGFPHGTEIFKL